MAEPFKNDREYVWVAFLLLFVISNLIWITIFVENNAITYSPLDLQMGTLIVTTIALIGSISYNVLTIRESKKAQKNRIKPMIAGVFIFLSTKVIILRVKNYGPGVAQDVKINLELVPKDHTTVGSKFELTLSVMSLTDKEEFGLETFDKIKFIQKFEGVKLHATCKDVEGFPYEFDQMLRSEMLTPKRGGITNLWENPRQEKALVNEITRSIKEVSSKVENLTKVVSSLEKKESIVATDDEPLQ